MRPDRFSGARHRRDQASAIDVLRERVESPLIGEEIARLEAFYVPNPVIGISYRRGCEVSPRVRDRGRGISPRSACYLLANDGVIVSRTFVRAWPA
jgi:hypothetical protein